MKNKAFHFRKFSVKDDRCAMKVGTDGVLLGAWVNVDEVKKILDVGTGCGLVALMLAQRTNELVTIDAIEIERDDASQASENFLNSPWVSRLHLFENSLQKFKSESKYDLIVSNPPYFLNSLLPPSVHRTRTRHTNSLTYQELIDHAVRMMNNKSRLAVILPYQEGLEFKSHALKKGLHLIRQLAFYSRKEKPQERWLLEFSFEKKELKEEYLVLYEKDNYQSEDYRKLTHDFYLK